ncbi:fatty acid desaturase [Spirulina sp.]|uniref:fatty acid desaturase n=1 Tax=Spirulina sp. TaxID=1157 RepID=UPI003F730A6C
MVASTKPDPPTALPSAKQLLDAQALAALNARSTLKGILQFTGHLSVILISGTLWLTGQDYGWAVQLVALVIYGMGLAMMFAAVHECSHRSVFTNNRLNDGVGWWAGVLSFYNSTFFRRYHKWHHRYTQIVGKDPELDDPKPQTQGEYWRHVLGLDWWLGKFTGHYQVATGQLEQYPYIPAEARAEVVRSTRLQLVVYLGAAIAVVALGHPLWLLTGWLLPLAVGQPFLRLVLLAEHTGCSHDNDPLTNTRTTLTLWPLRFLMWNMPFHTEHHLYPSIPFHHLPQAHAQLKAHFTHLESGYLQVNREIVAGLHP